MVRCRWEVWQRWPIRRRPQPGESPLGPMATAGKASPWLSWPPSGLIRSGAAPARSSTDARCNRRPRCTWNPWSAPSAGAWIKIIHAFWNWRVQSGFFRYSRQGHFWPYFSTYNSITSLSFVGHVQDLANWVRKWPFDTIIRYLVTLKFLKLNTGDPI